MPRSVNAVTITGNGQILGPNQNRKLLILGVPTGNNYLVSLGVDPAVSAHFSMATGQAALFLRVEDFGEALMGPVFVNTGGAVTGIIVEVTGN